MSATTPLKTAQTLSLARSGRPWDASPPRAGTFLVGRLPECEVRVPDRLVSRRHSAFVFTPGEGWACLDGGSLNGTWVNGQRLTPGILSAPLVDGDEVSLGDPCHGSPWFTVELAPLYGSLPASDHSQNPSLASRGG